MRISDMGFFNTPKMNLAAGNAKFSSVVNQLNTQMQQGRRNYDVAEFSSKIKQLKQSGKKEKTTDQPVIDFEDSPMNGSRTVAEWAEMSMTNYRNGLQSLSNSFDFQKQKLENAIEQIAKYEKVAAGEFSEEDLKWIAHNQKFVSDEIDWAAQRKEQAAEYVKRYKDSLVTDYTDFINDHLGIYTSFAKAYDAYSGGLASEVMGDLLKEITAEGLGLSNLSSSPDEIMKALHSATQKLGDTMKALEDAFYRAANKEMKPSDLQPDRQMWQDRIDMENMFLQRHEGAFIVGNKTISIDKI